MSKTTSSKTSQLPWATLAFSLQHQRKEKKKKKRFAPNQVFKISNTKPPTLIPSKKSKRSVNAKKGNNKRCININININTNINTPMQQKHELTSESIRRSEAKKGWRKKSWKKKKIYLMHQRECYGPMFGPMWGRNYWITIIAGLSLAWRYSIAIHSCCYWWRR